MGDVADEIAAHRLQATDSGEILENNQIALRAHFSKRGNDRLQEEVMVADINGFDLLVTRLAASLPQFDKLVMRGNLGEGTPHRLRLACIQDPGCGRIDELHPAMLISDQYPVRHVVEHGSQASPAPRPGSSLEPEAGRPYG